MNGRLTRRSLLAGAGCVTAGSLISPLLRAAQAEQSGTTTPQPGICLSMQFENGPKAKFEQDKYAKKHLPLLREVYGDSIDRIELRVPPASTSAMGMPSTLLATTTLWIRDVAAFGQKLGENAERLNKDLDGVARCNRQVQPDRIVFAQGDERSAVPAGTEVFSLYYRLQPAGFTTTPVEPAFDTQFFVNRYLPKLQERYGAALRRVEATIGMDQAGRKATQIAAYHLFIRDRQAYDTASRTVFTELQQDGNQLMQGLMPVFADMRIAATV